MTTTERSTRRTARRRAGLTIVLATLTIAGCGGDDVDPHKDFVADADAVCAKANARERALGGVGDAWPHGGLFDNPGFLAKITASGHTAARELRALKAPAADQANAKIVVDAVGEMVRALDGHLKILRAGRNDGESSNRYLKAYDDLVSAAGALGMTECQGVLF